MYASIYGYANEGNGRQHLGNIRNIEYTTNTRTYDFSSANIKGSCNFDMKDALIYVINTESGNAISSGFIKNIKKSEGNAISFNCDDFKRILDTDVIIDFTGGLYPNFTLQSM